MQGESIKKTLSFQLRMMVFALVVLLMPINFIFYNRSFHEQQKDRSEQMFRQIEKVIEMNERDLEAEREEFSELCIQKAEMLAYFVEHDPELAADIKSMRELAEITDVDEIHFFNKEGEIYTGTHPEYYGFTVYSGEQIGFFEQMLKDPELKLCQEIMPNTALGKEMQYAAVWMEDESRFVQIGMKPERLLRLMEEKSLQGTVGSIPFEREEYFHIVDEKQGKITASSKAELVGRDFAKEIALSKGERSPETVRQLHQDFNGEKYCVYVRQYKQYLLVHTYHSRDLLKETFFSAGVLLLGVLLATICVIAVFIQYVNRYVINNLLALNDKLKKIEQGDLEEVNIGTSILEFNTLIYYINQLLKSIRFDNKRMRDIIDSGQMPFGVFEYNPFYKKLFLNQRMKTILDLEDVERQPFEAEKNLILERLHEIQENCEDPNQDIYRYEKDGKAVYIKMKKYSDDQSVIYYLDDVSLWWNKMSVIKKESFRDILTGLLNRRGMQEYTDRIFENPAAAKEAAVVLLDADGLKHINDFYGHAVGDEYLKGIAAVLSELPKEHAICGRLGGDEFVMILYGYETREEMDGAIWNLSAMRGTEFASLQIDREETLEFSLGYAYYPSEGKTYRALADLADKRMYQEKRKRKPGR